MPRRSILSVADRHRLLALPENQADLIRHYTLTESDLAIIGQHRRGANRLGFALQLCYMRFPGIAFTFDKKPKPALLNFIATQIKEAPEGWAEYASRRETRREHMVELQSIFGFKSFTREDYSPAVQGIAELALQTDRGLLLAEALIESLRNRSILLPSLNVIDRLCAEAITRANRQIYALLAAPLLPDDRHALDALLRLRPEKKITTLAWLRQSPRKPSPKQMHEHIERLQLLQSLPLPQGIDGQVYENRLLKIAREGNQMTPNDLAKFEPERRYATLVAIALEDKATVTDEIVDLNDRLIGSLFNRAKRDHEQKFQESGKAINEKVRLLTRIGRALLKARQSGTDAFAAIEAVIPWDAFLQSVSDAEKLTQSEDFDYLPLIAEGYTQVRRYAPAFLDALTMKATSAAKGILDAAHVLKDMNAAGIRKIPKDAPTGFIGKRWERLVFAQAGIDRRYYELCVMSELRNALRAGDVWVEGSRQFKNFDAYMVPAQKFTALKSVHALPVAVVTDYDAYIGGRMALLDQHLKVVNRKARNGELPDAEITETGIKISPLTNSVPEEAKSLIRSAYSLLPHVKITDVLIEVDEWTGFTRHFTHAKSGAPAADKTLLLTTILADAINLGLTKMAEACPGTTYAKLAWLQAWHIRDETYATALADLVNTQYRHPFAAHWGDGTTSSSDGQRFRTAGTAEALGNINPKYGSDSGLLFYTHVSDQYTPFHTKVINVGVRDATYVLDGLLYHESDLRIEEHYTDTAGFTDHVFALMHILGFRFAPRIRDFADRRLYVPGKASAYAALSPMIGGSINLKLIRNHWDEILRLATSIKQGTVTASLILRKLASYPRQNGLAVALREFGRIERTLFTLDWLQNVELRRRVQAGLNKGEARNALARAVFLNRLGEIRDRNFANQRYRASGLTLVTAAIALWNTVYLERAIDAIRHRDQEAVNTDILRHLSPLGWEHINLTGDYVWRRNRGIGRQKLRPLRPFPLA